MSDATTLHDQEHHPDALAWAERVGEDADGHRRELVGGYVVVTPPPSNRHQRVCYLLSRHLGEFFTADHWVLQDAGLLLRADTLVAPDVMVVADPDEGWASTPEQVQVAVEVLSRSYRDYDRTTKARLYGNYGVNLCIIDPLAETVTTYQDGRAVHLFAGEEHIEDSAGINLNGPVSRYFA